MLAGFVWVLPLVCSNLTKSRTAGIAGGHVLDDYATFGLLGARKLSALEGHTLDALRKCCMARDCPEIPQSLVDASAFWVAANDKARSVIISLLCKENALVSLARLLGDTGFASHWLLLKLFHEDYIESLQSEVPLGTAINYQFNRAIEKHRMRLSPVKYHINERVLTATGTAFGDYVAQNGGRDTGFDLGVLAARKQVRSHFYILPEISKQIELWIARESMSAELVSRISELLRVILHSNMLSLSGSTEYRAYITRLVACSPHKELLALLNAVHNPRAVQSHITNILKKDGCRSIRPEFILRYLRWLKEFVSLSKPGIGFTWKRYLKDGYALSYALQVCETPQSFLAEVPHMWLFNIVTRMSKETADIPRRDDAMRVVMKSLSCYTFSRVLTKSELGKHRALMRFMLGYLDDEARIAYLASAKFLKSYNGKSRHKKFVDVYRDIEEELNSHISTARNTLAITSAVQ